VTFCPTFARPGQWHIGDCCQLHELVSPELIRDLLYFLGDTERVNKMPENIVSELGLCSCAVGTHEGNDDDE
jgi:hypothetical protein